MQPTRRSRSALSSTAAALLGLVAATVVAPSFAANPPKQKTTGSHIARDSQAADDTQLEPVEVMIGAVRDTRSAAREARGDDSGAPNLPQLDANAFLDDTATQPR